MGDVILERPVGRHREDFPEPGRDRVDELAERGEDVGLLGPEGVLVGFGIARAEDRIGTERIAFDLALAEALGPRLDQPQVVELVPMEGHVDPAPGVVPAQDLGLELAGERAELVGGRDQPAANLGRPDLPPLVAQGLVEMVEVAAVELVVGRPATGLEARPGNLDAQLGPAGQVGDVIAIRPVGTAGIRG